MLRGGGSIAGFLLAFCIVSMGLAAHKIRSSKPQASGGRASIKYVSYEVGGKNLSEVKEAIRARGPVDQFGMRRDAHTRWHIRWEWPVSPQKKPLIHETRVNAKIEVLVPVLARGTRLVGKELAEWERYVRALHAHEEVHVDFAMKTRAEIERQIIAGATVKQIKSAAQANAIGYRLLEELRNDDLSFDSETEHGMREGVILP